MVVVWMHDSTYHNTDQRIVDAHLAQSMTTTLEVLAQELLQAE